MVTGVLVATPVVPTGKGAVGLPARTVTLAGTVAAALLLESDTPIPPVGAAPFRVTVPVDETPPITVVGFRVTDVNCTAERIPRVAVCVTPLNIAEMVAVVEEATALVVMVKVADVLP